jgi:hypothetical protein
VLAALPQAVIAAGPYARGRNTTAQANMKIRRSLNRPPPVLVIEVTALLSRLPGVGAARASSGRRPGPRTAR